MLATICSLYSMYIVGVNSPVDIELLFVILYNITALHHNTNIFLWKSSNSNK